MKNQTKLHAVATPSQILREAIKHRASLAAEIETIRARAEHFAPIEREVGIAESELQALLQRDSDAMQAWVDAGASGPSPDPDHNTREKATRKVSDARAKLQATGRAKGQIEIDTHEAHERHQGATVSLRSAQSNVLGEELLRSASEMKAAALIYVAAEQHYFATRTALYDIDQVRATPIASQAGEIGRPMNVGEEREFIQQALAKSHQRRVALCEGCDPADAPQIAG